MNKHVMELEKGTVVTVTVKEFVEDEALVMLMSKSEWEAHLESLRGVCILTFKSTDMKHLSRSSPTCNFTVPETGTWVIAHQPWKASITIASS